eukprot:INCI19165.2.p1 GENE.INCI19165.2~~INCI19165.2.p1  ORF type:complete len:391 (+),score=38.86 INCI19165.2:121-1293(+)
MMFRLVSSLAACGLAVVAHAGVLEANQHDFTASFVNPPWDYESPHVNETCLKAPGPVKKGQARMVFSALPEGTPPQPSGKWPVFVHLVDMAFRATTPETKAACPKPNQQHGFDAFSTPIQAGDTCFGAANRSHMCDWNLNSGAMWDQRLKQLLLANGIAVVLVSPYSNDIWDTGDAWWNGFIDHTHGAVQKGGIDKQFLPALFHSMDAGDFGPLDLSKVVFHGFSAGAQMSSWMMQVLASNYSAPFPAQTKVAGAVMLSGGTYACYNDVPGYGPTPPVGSCQGCITGSPAACFSEKPGPRCSSCDPTTKPYCQQCCPRNFTEQHYQVITNGRITFLHRLCLSALTLFGPCCNRRRITQTSMHRTHRCFWDNAQPQTLQLTCARPEIILTR